MTTMTEKLAEAARTARMHLAALIPNPDSSKLDDWPCANRADRDCLQATYEWLTDGLSEFDAMRAAEAQDELHPATRDLVNRFSAALADKLLAAQRKYGYSDGWLRPDWMDECRANLMEHVAKGDPRDVANYCAFLWHHGQSTAAPAPRSGDAVTVSLREALLQAESLIDTLTLACIDRVDPANDPRRHAVTFALNATAADAPKAPLEYFSFGDDMDGFTTHATAAEARAAADECLDAFREDAADGWNDGVRNVCWGVILGGVEETESRPSTPDDPCHPDCSEFVEYELADYTTQPVAAQAEPIAWVPRRKTDSKPYPDGSIIRAGRMAWNWALTSKPSEPHPDEEYEFVPVHLHPAPIEVTDAMVERACGHFWKEKFGEKWSDASNSERNEFRSLMRAAFTDALSEVAK